MLVENKTPDSQPFEARFWQIGVDYMTERADLNELTGHGFIDPAFYAQASAFEKC